MTNVSRSPWLLPRRRLLRFVTLSLLFVVAISLVACSSKGDGGDELKALQTTTTRSSSTTSRASSSSSSNSTSTSVASTTTTPSTAAAAQGATKPPSPKTPAAPAAQAPVQAAPAAIAGGPPAGLSGTPVFGPDRYYVATAAVSKVSVWANAGDSNPATRLSGVQSSGFPLVFLVIEDAGDWLHVYLPIRPNGSAGWIRSSEVTLTQHNYRMRVDLSAHKLTVFQGGAVLAEIPIGVGTGNAPTPGGVFYTKELLKVPDASGPYGPYAYGLSGFSDVYQTFGSGPGTIGIHGTNDPGSIGSNVSHGCIRMTNDWITWLAATLPIGVPVEIAA